MNVPPLTDHPEVAAIVDRLTVGIAEALGSTLLGLYLGGSLTYGGFDPGSSDIDYLAVLHQPITDGERDRLKSLHSGIGQDQPAWAERIEGSYVTRDMLASDEPPPQGRPYVNGGAFWEPDPPYGNEWLINRHALWHAGIALAGPDPREVIPPVDIADVREASRRDLMEEWVPKLYDPDYFRSSHHTAYATLTLCRILHRAEHDGVASKRVAAAWVRDTVDEPWVRDLVERAERWRHGDDLDAEAEEAFILFVRDRLHRHDGERHR